MTIGTKLPDSEFYATAVNSRPAVSKLSKTETNLSMFFLHFEDKFIANWVITSIGNAFGKKLTNRTNFN